MAKITRYGGNFKAFGADAAANKRRPFGDAIADPASDTLDANMNADFFAGWEIIGPAGVPPLQWFNAMGFTATQGLAYLHQMGIAEYHAAQEYPEHGLCNRNGAIYRSLANANIGNTPESTPGSWEPVTPIAALTANVTVTVGAAGDYASINAALAAVTALYTPVHVSPSSRRVTINILAGYVMAERLIFDGIDLSWITITGADAETTMTQSEMGGFLAGAIRVVNGAKAPIISQLFTMDSSGANTASGVYCSNSWVTFTSGAGIKNGRGVAVNAAQSGVIVAQSCNFSGFGTALGASNMSSVDVRNTNLTPTSDGIVCAHGSRINANGATVGPAVIQCYDGSEVLADGVTVIEIECTNGSRVSFVGGTTTATTGIVVLTGSIVAAGGSTSTLSIAANTVTAAGIIFK